MVFGSNAGRGKSLFFPPKRPDWLWDPPSLPFNGYGGSFPGVKRPGSDANHLRPSCVDVDNEWRYSSASPVCLHVVDSQKSTFFIV